MGVCALGRAQPAFLSNFQTVLTPPKLDLSHFFSDPLPFLKVRQADHPPTLVSRRKARTAGIALSPWKSSWTKGALGCFHLQASPTLFYISLLLGARRLQLVVGLALTAMAPPVFAQRGPSYRGQVDACPERS